MHETVTEERFINAFLNSKTWGAGWGNYILSSLFHHLEELEEDCDIRLEFDLISINCDYNCWQSLEEFKTECSLWLSEKDSLEINTLGQLEELLNDEGVTFISNPNCTQFIVGAI